MVDSQKKEGETFRWACRKPHTHTGVGGGRVRCCRCVQDLNTTKFIIGGGSLASAHSHCNSKEQQDPRSQRQVRNNLIWHNRVKAILLKQTWHEPRAKSSQCSGGPQRSQFSLDIADVIYTVRGRFPHVSPTLINDPACEARFFFCKD